jgi:hypothetical protein
MAKRRRGDTKSQDQLQAEHLDMMLRAILVREREMLRRMDESRA